MRDFIQRWLGLPAEAENRALLEEIQTIRREVVAGIDGLAELAKEYACAQLGFVGCQFTAVCLATNACPSHTCIDSNDLFLEISLTEKLTIKLEKVDIH